MAIYLTLTPEQRRLLLDALLDAYCSADDLEMLVSLYLGQNLKVLVKDNPLKKMTFDLIHVAEAKGWLVKLVEAARQETPNNQKLMLFAQALGLAPAIEYQQGGEALLLGDEDGLERMVRPALHFLDLPQWGNRLMQLGSQVCRIEIATNKGMAYGTGFLLGPDVVMTNYHVMEPVILGEAGGKTASGYRAGVKDVILRFDYQRLADGTTLSAGSEFRLPAQDWLIDQSPNNPVGAEPTPQQLDYALLRVAGSPGMQGVTTHGGGSRRRGWVPLAQQPHAFDPGSALYIIQHPKGEPVKLALDTSAILSVSPNGARVRYSTNTEPGSSGSPCFSPDWELVALHHSGDPKDIPTYNEGIPFATILKLLGERGHLAKVSQPMPTDEHITKGEAPMTEPPAPSQKQPPATVDRKMLRTFLTRHFNENSLQELYFDMGLKYEDLGGGAFGNKVIELVMWSERYNRFRELVEAAHKVRPDAPWE